MGCRGRKIAVETPTRFLGFPRFWSSNVKVIHHRHQGVRNTFHDLFPPPPFVCVTSGRQRRRRPRTQTRSRTGDGHTRAHRCHAIALLSDRESTSWMMIEESRLKKCGTFIDNLVPCQLPPTALFIFFASRFTCRARRPDGDDRRQQAINIGRSCTHHSA